MAFNEENYYLPANHKFLTNPKLRKSVVGRTRGAPDPLPRGDAAIYGRPNNRNEEGAGEVVQFWKTHTPNPEAIAHRDFVRTNKMAASDGCTTAKANTKFRSTHMYRQRKGPNAKSNSDKVLKEKLERETFGQKNRPSTPIKRLIMGDYQRRWVQGQKDLLQKKPRANRLGMSPPELHAHSEARNVIGSKEPFKMKQFTSVKSRVELPDKNWHLKLRQKRDELEKEEELTRVVPGEPVIDEPAQVAEELAHLSLEAES